MTSLDFMFGCFGISAIIFGASFAVAEVRRRKYWNEYNKRKHND